jgi:hypothetical protein
VLVDHRQNGWGKTIASAYSVRPKPGAPVSTPLRWEELTPEVRPRDFTMDVALVRVEEHGDLFAPVLAEPRPLGPALKRLGRARHVGLTRLSERLEEGPCRSDRQLVCEVEQVPVAGDEDGALALGEREQVVVAGIG